MAEMTGRCACGHIRWRSEGPVLWAGHCHCESCRRATSAAFTSFFGVPRASVHWSGPVTERLSSDGRVRRRYCPDCGTQLSYQATKWPDETHLYAATLDDPAQFEPKAHFHYAERVAWVVLADILPRYAATSDGAEPLPPETAA